MQIQSLESYNILSNLLQHDKDLPYLHLRPYLNSLDLQILKTVDKQFSILATDWQRRASKVIDQENRAKIFACNLAKIEKSKQLKPYEYSINLKDPSPLTYVEASYPYVVIESIQGLKIFNRLKETFVDLPEIASQTPVFYRIYSNDLLIWANTRQLCVYHLKEAKAIRLKTDREIEPTAILDFQNDFAHLIDNQLIYKSTPNKLKIINLKNPNKNYLIDLGFDSSLGALGQVIFEDRVLFWGNIEKKEENNTKREMVLKVLDRHLKLTTYSLPLKFSGNILSVHFLTHNRLVVKTESVSSINPDSTAAVEKKYSCQFIEFQSAGKTKIFAKAVPYFIEDFDEDERLIYPADEIRIQNGIFSNYFLSHTDPVDGVNHFKLFVMYPDLTSWTYPCPQLASYEVSEAGVAATPIDKMYPIVWLKGRDELIPYREQTYINMQYDLLGIFHDHAVFLKDANGMNIVKRKLYVYKMTGEPALDKEGKAVLTPVKIIEVNARSRPLLANQQTIYYWTEKTRLGSKKIEAILLDLDKIIVSEEDHKKFVKLHPEYKIKKAKNRKSKHVFTDEIVLSHIQKAFDQ